MYILDASSDGHFKIGSSNKLSGNYDRRRGRAEYYEMYSKTQKMYLKTK